MKLTSKQELFAREIAKGTNQYQSFCIAYPLQGRNSKRESLDCNASQLANSTKIVQRVAKLQNAALNHVKYDVEAHYLELERLKKIALLEDSETIPKEMDLKTAGKMVELKGKMKGLYITKTENLNTNILSNEEAESKLRDFAEKLGLTYEEYKERMGIA